MRVITNATLRRDCLVVHIATDAELQRALRDRYYRIPERVVGQAIGEEGLAEADLIALYQGENLREGLSGAIEFVASIRCRERLRRRDLIPDEPTHPRANEQYIVLRLGRCRRLPRPIVAARPRRVSFLRTTRGRIRHAVTVSDLIIGNREEERLWRRMQKGAGVAREAEKERKWLVNAGGTVMEVEIALFHGDRRVAVVRDPASARNVERQGWRVVSFSPASSDADVVRIVEQLLTGC